MAVTAYVASRPRRQANPDGYQNLSVKANKHVCYRYFDRLCLKIEKRKADKACSFDDIIFERSPQRREKNSPVCPEKLEDFFSLDAWAEFFPSFQPQYVVFFWLCSLEVVMVQQQWYPGLLLLSSYNLMVHTGTIYETPKVNPQRGASSAHGIRKFLEKKSYRLLLDRLQY